MRSFFVAVLSAAAVLVGSFGSAMPARAASYGENLIVNASFMTVGSTASVPLNWKRSGWGTNDRVLTYPVAGRTDAKAIRATMTTRSSGDANWLFTPVPAAGGQAYQFSDWYKSDTVSAVTVQYGLQNGTFKYVDIVSGLPPASAWTQVTRTFTVPTTFASPVVSISVFHLISSVGSLTTDDYSLRRDVSGQAATNLIANPSVESQANGLPSGWAKGGWGTNDRVLMQQSDGHAGTKSLRVEVSNYVSGDAKWYFTPVAVVPGNTYTYSDWYKSSVVSKVTVQYVLQNGAYQYVDLASGLPASSGWTQVTRTFTVPTNTASPVARLSVFHLIGSNGWLQTDDFSLTTPQPPATTQPVNLFANPALEIATDGSPSVPTNWSRALSSGATGTFTYPVAGRGGTGSAARVDIGSYSSGAGAKWYPHAVPVGVGNEYEYGGWYKSSTESMVTVQFQFDDGSYGYADLAKLNASADWKQVQKTFVVPPRTVRATVMHFIRSVGSLTLDDVRLVQRTDGKFAAGMLTLQFDDGLSSVWSEAKPLFDAAGMKGSLDVITRDLGTPGVLTAAQVQSLHASGYEIGSHTLTHAHLTRVSPQDARREIEESKADLAALGVSHDTFVYPYGELNEDVRQMVIDAGYRGARSVRSGFNTKNTDRFALFDQHVESTTTIEDLRGWIDRALLDRTWLILELHDINDSGEQYSASPELLRQLLAYVQSRGIEVVSMSAGLSRMQW